MGALPLFDDYLAAGGVAACFDSPALVANMLAFETALAEVEGELGLIPSAAVGAIVAAAEIDGIDLDELREQTVRQSNPAIPLVARLTARVAEHDRAAARYVHWGSTSQDVMDTAMMLSCRAALEGLHDKLLAVETRLCAWMGTHRRTPMVARTLSQHAGPTTFGAKVAAWLNGLLAVHERLGTLHAALPLQFGGASGTLAAFGTRGADVADGVAARLGLRAVPPWHTERTAVRDLAAWAGALAAALGKIANDIVLMAQTEVAELRHGGDGSGGSSALPQKRNPVAAIGALAGARRAPGLLASVYAAFDQDHERAAGAWHAETTALGELFVVTGGVVENLERALEQYEPDADAMRRNLELGGGLGMAESVVMTLAPAIGRAAAHGIVKAACTTAIESGSNLVAVLAGDPRVTAHVDEAALGAALDPLNFLGIAEPMIDQAHARALAMRGPAVSLAESLDEQGPEVEGDS